MREGDGVVLTAGRRDRLLIGLVLLFAAGLFAFRLGSGSLWDQDETKYAQVGREILTAGDPVTMHLNARPWYGRPPLWMWLQAGAGWAFGFTESAARVWAAAFGVLGVGVTCLLGRAWFGPRTGLLAGLILATMLEYLVLSRLAVLDVAQMVFVLLALHAFYRGYRDHRRADYLRSFLYLALATITRGPIVLALPVVVLGTFLAYRRALRRWREIPWGWGAAIYLAVAAPWYVLEAARAGPAFAAAIDGETLARVSRPLGDHASVALYNLAVVIFGAVPWTAFLPGALVYLYTQRWHDGSLLCLLWCGAAFVLATAAGASLPDDVAPLFPLAAIAIARLWEEFLFEGAGRFRRMLVASFFLQIGVVLLLAAAATAFATGRYPQEFAAVQGALVAPLAALVLGPALTAVLFRYRQYTAAFLALPATMAVFVGVLFTHTAPVVEAQKPMKPVAAAIRSALRPGDRIVGYRIGAPPSLIYYTNHLVDWVNDRRTLQRLLCAPGRAFLVTTRAQRAAARTALPPGLQPLAAHGEIVVEFKPETAVCGGEA